MIVLRRCAMMRRVLLPHSLCKVRWICASVCASTLAVASSSTRILDFRSTAEGVEERRQSELRERAERRPREENVGCVETGVPARARHNDCRSPTERLPPPPASCVLSPSARALNQPPISALWMACTSSVSVNSLNGSRFRRRVPVNNCTPHAG